MKDIYEFLISSAFSLPLIKLNGVKYVRKRKDLFSFFVSNKKAYNRFKQNYLKGVEYKEFKLEKEFGLSNSEKDFFIESVRFTTRNANGKACLKVLTQVSFGFNHPATQLTLSVLSEKKHFFEAKRVLDVGTGSGILSLYISKKGAKKVLGIDIDPFIVEEAIKNRKLNRLKKNKVTFLLKDITQLKKAFSLIVANVPLNVHELIAEDVYRLLDSKGYFIVGGFLTTQQDKISKIYNKFTQIEDVSKEDWHVRLFVKS